MCEFYGIESTSSVFLDICSHRGLDNKDMRDGHSGD